MSNMAMQFITQLKRNLELWRAHEIDFGAFTEAQRQTWAAIRTAGTDTEAEVLRGLMGGARLPDVMLLADDQRRTVAVRTPARSPARPTRRYYGDLARTAVGSPILRIAPIDPRSSDAQHRQIAAKVYDLAADMERRSQELEVNWAISPDADIGEVVVELAGEHEAELANEFIANVMAQHQLLQRPPSSGNDASRRVGRNDRAD